MLKESEWKMINNILLELYMTESIEDLASKFFKIIKTLIQYTSGYMLPVSYTHLTLPTT